VDAEGEIVVLDTQRSIYLGLNREGVALWRMLAESTTQRALEAGLVEAFGITRERAEHDVAAFLARLTELGLLVRHDA
jgi:coenzyme PQQ synthesis protein D (PqqD)